MAHISNINILESISIYYKYGIIFGVTLSKVGSFFILQRKVIRIMAGAQPRTSCRSQLKQSEVLPVPCQYVLSLTNFIINNQEIFKHIHLDTILIQVLSITFIDQMPTYLVFKKVPSMLA